jgi:formylglycine-generating enzyme required for sulfatase activity
MRGFLWAVCVAVMFLAGAGLSRYRQMRRQRPAPTPSRRVETSMGKAGIEWVTIPGGSFTMGAEDMGPDAQPPHQVTVPTFRMAKTLVTNKQYQACVAAGACKALGDCGEKFRGDEQPAVCMDWDQAEAFSHWAGGRLPSEAEWEYAARGAGRERRFPWGDEAADCEKALILGCNDGATAPVCWRPQGNTEQGLCDMAGNAWEWVEDRYHGSYEGAPTDGEAWDIPAAAFRVVRGGSWFSDGEHARSARRGSRPWAYQNCHVGFRPAMSRER